VHDPDKVLAWVIGNDAKGTYYDAAKG